MSKNHVDESQADLDAALDDFISNKKVKPAVNTVGRGVDIFGDGDVKKKSLLHRIMEYLNPFRSRPQLR